MAFAYQIRHTPTGRYSTGGMSPRFTAKGKVWNTKGSLSAHLNLIQPSQYKDCVIVEIEIVRHETSSVPVHTLLQAKQDEKRKKEIAKAAARAAEAEKHERELLARLQSKYPKS